MKFIKGFVMAWGCFTIIPAPTKIWDEGARKHMLFALPLVGLFIGAIWCGLYLALNMTGLHPAMKAAIMTAYPFIISGCIHLDGFMDCNDAILSRRPLEDRQRILKDSHVGAFAVISVVLMFLMYFASMWAVVESKNQYMGFAFFFVPMVSRWMAATNIIRLKPMNTSQYQDISRKGETIFVVLFILIATAIIIGMHYWTSGAGYGDARTILSYMQTVLLVTMLTGIFVGRYAAKQLGGMNGDISGYGIVWSELAAVIAMGAIV